MGGESKIFTLAEVSEHNHHQDCWLVIDGKVYDVTNYLGDHPGGDQVMLSATGMKTLMQIEEHHYINIIIADSLMHLVYIIIADSFGKDATDDFEDVGHSTSARTKMEEFYVGNIDTNTIPTKVEFTPPKQANNGQDKSPEFIIKLLKFLVPLLILGLAVGIRFYTKSLSA